MRYMLSALCLCVFCAYACLATAQNAEQLLPDYTLSQIQSEQLGNNAIITDVRKGPKGRTYVFGAVEIDTTPQNIWAIMTDCSVQLDIIPKLKSCEVLDTDPMLKSNAGHYWDIRRQIVKLGFPLPSVRSEFRSDYTPFQSIIITGTGGDLSVLNGEWILTPLSETRTRLTYRARMKSAMPVPSGFIRKAVRKDMPTTLRNLRHIAEAAAQ